MPTQLPVVVSQTTANLPDQREFEETLVQRLILDERADVRLINAIESTAPDSSDRLMLEGIDRDFVFLVWLSPAEAHAQLQRLGIHGRRAVHRGDADASQEVGRRIYCIDLSRCNEVEGAIGLIREASRDRQTSTIQIGNVSPRIPGPQAPQPLPTVKQPENQNPPLPIPEADVSKSDDDRLESLVDELDRLDW